MLYCLRLKSLLPSFFPNMKIEVSSTKQIYSYYEEEIQILFTEYKGMFNEENAFEHFHKVEAFVSGRPLLGIVADLRKLNGSYNKVMEYFKSEGYPKIKKSGLIAEAFIISDDIMINYLTEKLMSVLKQNNVRCSCFDSEKEAHSWILTEIGK